MTAAVNVPFRDTQDGFCASWFLTIARSEAFNARTRSIALMIGSLTYWKAKVCRVETRTISQALGCTEGDVLEVVGILCAQGYAEHHGYSANGRPELRLIYPRAAQRTRTDGTSRK